MSKEFDAAFLNALMAKIASDPDVAKNATPEALASVKEQLAGVLKEHKGRNVEVFIVRDDS